MLAKRFNVRVTAIDVHQPFLDQLGRSAQAAGLSELIVTRRASMTALECPPESVDLIWCEGAIYIVGFQAGLRLWRPLLRPRGLAVVSECSWLTGSPPAEAAAFFKAAYPDMAGVEQNIARATAEGYDVFDYFLLPQQAWWDEYYTPLQERIALLRHRAADNPELAAVLAETEGEITVFSRFGDSYGYVFYLMRKGDRDPFGKA